MKSTLMGWTEDQWQQAFNEYKRVSCFTGGLRSMFSAMRGDRVSIEQYVTLNDWWKTKYSMDPPDRPVVKPKESKPMSTERLNFGFPCKVINMGWTYDPLRGVKVFELRVAVGEAVFVSQESIPDYMVGHSPWEDMRLVKEFRYRCVERLKRELFDKLFPNL